MQHHSTPRISPGYTLPGDAGSRDVQCSAETGGSLNHLAPTCLAFRDGLEGRSVRLGFSEAAACRFTAFILAADRSPIDTGGRTGTGGRRAAGPLLHDDLGAAAGQAEAPRRTRVIARKAAYPGGPRFWTSHTPTVHRSCSSAPGNVPG